MSGDPYRLLVLGGTRFVGRVVVETALERGWEVTVLNRGTQPCPSGAVAVEGDRTRPGALAQLGPGDWDLVVDTWSWGAGPVREAAEQLTDRIGHYVYVSSRSVHPIPTAAGADETAATVTPDDAPDADYGPAKAASERALVDVLGERALLARAGLILGRYEDVGRLPWWLARIRTGGPVLAPGPPALALQYIDVRDLASWLLDAGVAKLAGPFNTVGPPGHATMHELLEACVHATGTDAELVWAEPAVLDDAGVAPWTELPIWLPPGPLHDTMHGADVTAAVRHGLRCRPIADTVADTWAWMRSSSHLPQRDDRPAVGLAPAREREILDLLRRR